MYSGANKLLNHCKTSNINVPTSGNFFFILIEIHCMAFEVVVAINALVVDYVRSNENIHFDTANTIVDIAHFTVYH